MTPRLQLLLSVLAAGLLYIPACFSSSWAVVGNVATVLVILLAIIDWLRSPALSQMEVDRKVGRVLSVGARNPITIEYRWKGRSNWQAELHDEPPHPGAFDGLPAVVPLVPGRWLKLVYHFTPARRGNITFQSIHWRARSPWGFWQLHWLIPRPMTTKVYPDVQAIRGVELLARQNRLAESGVRMTRLHGKGSAFDRLREYRREDEFRSIDWKASARQESLIAREYTIEKNQTIVLVLDSGRSMCHAEGVATHFDRALNSALLLAYTALRQGDHVGLLACSSKVQASIPPVRGLRSIDTLIRNIYDIEPEYTSTDYQLMVDELRRRYRKRALVVVLTYALDDVHLEQMARQFRRLRSPHLVICAFLSPESLVKQAESVPQTDQQAFEIAAAADLLQGHRKTLRDLTAMGLFAIEATPETLTSQLISRYLEVKARSLI